MCGPTGAEKNLESSEQNLDQMLQTSFQQSFAEQQSVLKTLSGSLTPLVSAGPNQQGFSSPELANLNTTAIDASGAGARNAEQALNNSLAGRGGGGIRRRAGDKVPRGGRGLGGSPLVGGRRRRLGCPELPNRGRQSPVSTNQPVTHSQTGLHSL